MDPEANCHDCTFWDRDHELGSATPHRDPPASLGTGECRRHGPRPRFEIPDPGVPENDEIGSRWVVWPKTYSDNWCGEFERSKEEQGGLTCASVMTG